MSFLILIFFVSASYSTLGVDVSQPCLPKGWSCLKDNGFHFGVIRCYMSSGKVDPNCPHTVYNAWQGGMKNVDVYLFPHPKGGKGADQVKDMVAYLKSYDCKYGMIWLDIEGTQYWLGSKSANIKFFNELLVGVNETGVNAGIYASYYQWEELFGLDYHMPYHLPLWYAHYDNNPSFSDFKAFGGWTKPSIKQFKGTTNICGCGIDKNWYP